MSVSPATLLDVSSLDLQQGSGNRARYQVRSFRAVFLQGDSLSLGHRAGKFHRFPQAGMKSERVVAATGDPAPPVRHLWEDGSSHLLSPVRVWVLWEPEFLPHRETGDCQWIIWKSSTCPHVLGFCPFSYPLWATEVQPSFAGCPGKHLYFCFLITTNHNYKAEARTVDKNKQSKSLTNKNGLDMILT